MAKTEYTDVTDLSDKLLICKALWQHDWDDNPSPRNIDGPVARMAHAMVCLRCSRCRRERYTYLDSKGNRIGPHRYFNPKDYPKTHQMTNQVLWSEMIKRSLLVRPYQANGGKTKNQH
jgi:hypothetical protein